MITITKGIIEKKVHEYFNKVEETGEEIIVTSDMIPVLKIIPLKKKKNANDIFADVRGKVKYHGDILEPEIEEWGAL